MFIVVLDTQYTQNTIEQLSKTNSYTIQPLVNNESSLYVAVQ